MSKLNIQTFILGLALAAAMEPNITVVETQIQQQRTLQQRQKV